jgi:N-acetylneuraminic acid mutarotase
VTGTADSAGKKVILFGGANAESRLNDTWMYDPTADSWTMIDTAGSHPSERWFQSMAYDPGTGTVVLFGGWGDPGFLGDTWVFDPVADRWAKIDSADTAPPGRNLQAMVYDAGSGRMLMFGGYTAGSDSVLLLNDMWACGPTP